MFEFVDLFAGIGGFHAALASVGGQVAQAAEIDPAPARVYERNWGVTPDVDVRDLAGNPFSKVRDHAVLVGGFPCQPFSKSGRQLGVLEDRGTLFQDILRILDAKQPPLVMLENVRNIAGPRQRGAWTAVVAGLRRAGYRVSGEPCVFSPHLLSPEDGGAAQVRERVFILGVHVGRGRAETETEVRPVVENRPQNGWDPQGWSIAEHVLLPDEINGGSLAAARVTVEESLWIDTWNELVARLGPHVRLPGFPLWEPYWRVARPRVDDMPLWKQRYVGQNHEFYLTHRATIDAWRASHPQVRHFPLSRRKLEWQAQDSERDLWKLLLQLRPSGIRVKKPTYAPALVAMNQTSIYGPARRRLTPLEAAKLQGFDPYTFSFGNQRDALSYKQVGNAVNVGAVRYVFKRFVEVNAEDIAATGPVGAELVETVLGSSPEQEIGAA
jgi:DNA (cytosine-5)-methyltransferase 1